MKNPFAKKRNDYESYEDYDSGFYRGDEEEAPVRLPHGRFFPV